MVSTKFSILEDELGISVFDEDENQLEPKDVRYLAQRLTTAYSEDAETYVYLVYSHKYELHKIGLTGNIKQRIANLRQVYEHSDISLIYQHKCANRKIAEKWETILHEFFKHQHVSYSHERKLGREWFKLTPNDVSFFKSSTLLMEFADTYAFHPMALLRYVSGKDGIDPYIRQILVHFAEMYTRFEPVSSKDNNHYEAAAAD